MNKVFQKPWHNFRIFLNVSIKYYPMSIAALNVVMYRACITKRLRTIWQRLTDFWIKKKDILRLFACSVFSASTACYKKSRCDRVVALWILLKRLSNPYRCKGIVLLFEQNPIEFGLIFTLDFIYQRHHHRLESWN